MDQQLVVTVGFMPSGFEWVVIMLALLLLFGRRLPEVMRGLGGSVKEFKKGMEEGPAKIETPAAPTPRVDGAVSRDQQSPAPSDQPADRPKVN